MSLHPRLLTALPHLVNASAVIPTGVEMILTKDPAMILAHSASDYPKVSLRLLNNESLYWVLRVRPDHVEQQRIAQSVIVQSNDLCMR